MVNDSINATKLNGQVEAEIGCRIGVVVKADSADEAANLADQYFVEVLDFLTVEYTMSQLELAHCGYVRNLDTDENQIISNQQFDMGTLFIRSQGLMSRLNSTQALLLQEGDLLDRYKRSIHWSRNAILEKSPHLTILYRWFAVEALFKENDTDDVTSPLMLFLGFPTNTFSKYLSRDMLKRLSDSESYRKWKLKIGPLVNRIRKFRNDSVHSGFRSIDCTADDLRLFDRLLTVGLSRCQGAVHTGVLSGFKSVSEFKEYAGLIFENNPNVERDILETIVYILDRDSLRHVPMTHM